MYELSLLPGRTALVTGASTGIGAEFSRQLAARGANLVLVARSIDKLEAAAEALRKAYGVDVTTVKLDLSEPGASEQLFRRVADLSVDFLVNNAGLGDGGPAADLSPERAAALVDLNVKAVVENTVRFLPAMVARGSGAIINVASTGGFQPAPYMAAYAASKAFVLSFTQAVSAENADTGVRVLALCPGPTETPMMSGQDSPMGKLRSPAQVVATALKALGTRKASVVDGRLNAVVARFGSRLPESMLLGIGVRVLKKNLAASARSAPAPLRAE
jgi:short-subunit dehydrogenase